MKLMMGSSETSRDNPEPNGSDLHGSVFVYQTEPDNLADEHERATRANIAEKLAALKGFRFAGKYDSAAGHERPFYFVPNDTLISGATADELGVSTVHDLFGGVAPWPFVATKAITHALVAETADAPTGWSAQFNKLTNDAVVRGFTVFTQRDAQIALAELLTHGPVRIKPVRATGGRGQKVLTDARQLDCVIEGIHPDELATFGLVIEEDLSDVETCSVGQVIVDDLVATYCGRQRLTEDNAGGSAYGGSDLLVAKGAFEELNRLQLPKEMQLAIEQAQTYDRAAAIAFPTLVASRRNYDVVQGRDHRGQWKSGVLEQSWRIGGASSAEVAALGVFRADSRVKAVHASSVEAYGNAVKTPDQASVSFAGVDNRVGPITKYTMVTSYGGRQEGN